MLLVKAQVQSFRSIENSGEVDIDPDVTVLVGQNESGKTAFLHALNLCRPVETNEGFDIDRDYPRKGLNEYRRRHNSDPAEVVVLTYELSPEELGSVNNHLGLKLLDGLRFSTTHHYKNNFSVRLSVSEAPYIHHLVSTANLPSELREECQKVTNIRALVELLSSKDLNTDGQAFLESLTTRFKMDEESWKNLLSLEIWSQFLRGWLPKFFYFDDYHLLPGKVNLRVLAARATTPDQQDEEDKAAISLLRLAGVDLADLTSPQGYEPIKSRLEGLSISITDTIFKFWKQNTELDVEFDIREDPKDREPFNSGPNLYIRIKNRRHRMTVPFSQRSKGFIWFFSFIVWFDTIRQQLGKDEDLILLLDEPGLSLHALAQADFLRYIDSLAEEHQIIYTTHSPFMVHSDRLHQVRTVEDLKEKGTFITSDVTGSDAKTIFPLQAALGYTVAQNLFIGKRNLLVEGPADLVYLKYISAVLEKAGRTVLRDDITIVPTGGLDKVATFIALLGANQLELTVLHDWASKPDQRLDTVVEQRLIKEKHVLNYGQFREPPAKTKGAPAVTPPATDVEDLFTLSFYLKLFNGAFEKKLPAEVTEAALPCGDRIIGRLDRYLADTSISLRARGGFNHYAVANYLVTNPPKTVDKETLNRFEQMFNKVNSLFSEDE